MHLTDGSSLAIPMETDGDDKHHKENTENRDNKDEEEEEGIVGCIPQLLDSSHRTEILHIVDELPKLIEGDMRIGEKKLDRYTRLLYLYHEQPTLLDCIIPQLLNTLLAYITLPTTTNTYEESHLDALSVTAFNYLAVLTNVRGYKVIMRLVPHEVTYLEKLMTALSAFDGPCGEDWNQRYVLLLWLWIVAKNPFDLRKFDKTGDEKTTIKRIFDLASKYLDYKYDGTQIAASLLIAQCLSRTEGVPLIELQLQPSLTLIERIEPQINEPVGHLLLVAAVLKKVDRIHLHPHVDPLASALRAHFPLNAKLGELTRKCLVKVLQRLALVMLRPKLAAWRYRRGRRKLEENLVSSNGAMSAASTSHKATAQNGTATATMRENGVDDCQMEEEEDEHIQAPHEIVEWALGCILDALADDNTYVRWSAAKGIGRITARLPKELASQVVESIVARNFDRLAGHCSWHGGCMALAEMARRGFLLPTLLPQTFPVVEEALFYEEPMGKQGLGNKVRDAACYIMWAFARAYDPVELRPYIDKVATSLICAALFDREVNLRRAASAAFQENVGRQADFPDGISLLTLVDYFALGNRRRCFERLAVQAAAFDKYALAIVDHLIERKVIHWDETVREQAALSLEKLAETRPQLVGEKLGKLVEGCRISNPIHRHGYILASAHAIKGLRKRNFDVDKGLISSLANLPSALVDDCRKWTSVAGLLTRKALGGAFKQLALAGVELQEKEVNLWLERVETFAGDKNERVREMAIEAAEVIIPSYVHDEYSRRKLVEGYCEKLDACTREEEEYIGLCAVAACVARQASNAYPLFLQLCQFITKCREPLWARARAASVDALPLILPATASTSQASDRKRENDKGDIIAECFHALERALEDYTTNSMGDVGRFVRQSGMRAMSRILTQHAQLVGAERLPTYTLFCVKRMLEQSAGKIGRTRECAARSLQLLLQWNLSSDKPSLISHSSALSKVFNERTDFVLDTSLLQLVPLLNEAPDYFGDLMHGLVISAGSISEITKQRGREALLAYLEEYAYGNAHKLEAFFACIAELLERGCKVPRIGMSVLRYLPQALAHTGELEKNPDASEAIQRIIRCLVKVAAVANAPPVRVRLVIESFATLLNFPQESTTWKIAAHQVVDYLFCKTPVLRRAAAEALYEALCISSDDVELLSILSETVWHDTSDAIKVEQAAAEVKQRLLGQ